MTSHPNIHPQHLERPAYVYIRQSSPQQVKHNLESQDMPTLWQVETTTNAERKRLLRCLIQDVTLDRFSKEGWSIIRIRWHGGTTTTVEVEWPQPGCWTPPTALRRIRELVPHHPDDQIATMLNEEGLQTGKGLAWTRNRATDRGQEPY